MNTYAHTRVKSAEPRLFIADSTRPQLLLDVCPMHTPTRMASAPALADELGIATLELKMESERMGLGSFKALGGAFAVAQMVRDHAELFLGFWLPPDATCSDAVLELAGDMTFITASAGNHGLSVAAGAGIFGAKAVIVLSSTVPEEFATRIEELGAQVERVAGSYEDSVDHAIALANTNGWQLLADGSWDGYIDPPALVMEGYTVLAQECRQKFEFSGKWPTHVFLQAGVGGLASSFAAHVRDHWPVQPVLIVVEPDAAPCLQSSVKAGELTNAPGPVSNMGRLDCKDASLIAFDSLNRDADFFVTVSDAAAADAASRLTEAGFGTTPSGGAGFCALALGEIEGIDAQSRCLCIVSEQD